MTKESPLKLADNRTQMISDALAEIGLEPTGAMLSEGFCPLCQKRGSDSLPWADEFDEANEHQADAIVNCIPCDLRWRSGPNDNGLPWIEFSQSFDHMRLTMTLNGPMEDVEDEYDDEWFE